MAKKDTRESFVKSLLDLPVFQELDDAELTEDEKRQISEEAKSLLRNWFENLLALRKLKEKKSRKKHSRHKK
ncbi:MAG: hypothetical protein HY617_01710 [Candidatus Sungbacteria bacterium]|nr:hypothetical protein [Candidatus Sungbacteria bacterium]